MGEQKIDDVREVPMKILLPAGMLGIGIGWLIFRLLNDDALRIVLGCIAIGFVLNTVLRRNMAAAKVSRAKGWFWGTVSGVTTFVAQAGGPPILVYLLPQRLDKRIHSGTLGFMVNVDALKGKPVPNSWADLLKPDYKGLIGYLDPASAFVGYVGAVAINQARGGTLDNFGPAMEYFKALKKNDPIVPKQTSYARVLSGEIAILLDYDFNAYRAKYKDKANVEFVIPSEGTLVVPYVMSLVQKGPNADNGKKVLDFVLSDEGQAIWANAYLRPVRASAIPKDVQSRFLPASEYARAKTVDYGKMADVQKGFSDRYIKEVQ
mgnify:CR=1 FL=1